MVAQALLSSAMTSKPIQLNQDQQAGNGLSTCTACTHLSVSTGVPIAEHLDTGTGTLACALCPRQDKFADSWLRPG